jgi:plasmid replication initiation protein
MRQFIRPSANTAQSERDRLDPFFALAGDIAFRDQRDLMERPFFSLSKSRRTAPIAYQAGDTQVHVMGLAEHGIATIWDADILIWAASHLVEALDRGLPTSRFFRFTPYQLLGGIGRGRGQRDYLLLKSALKQSEVERAIKSIASQTGLEHQSAKPGEIVSGLYRQRIDLAAGRFAMLDAGTGFELVPWKPELEQFLGKQLNGVAMPGGGIEWELGRGRGIGR